VKAAALQIRAMSRCAEGIAPPLGWLKPDLIPPPWPGAYAPVVILISEANEMPGEPNGEPTEADVGRRKATSSDDQSS
jgi:hypothetical protein